MDAKHQFKYTYSDTGLEEFSPVEVTFDMPGEVTISQMLYNFESYLKACGFYFDGHLEIVNEAFNVLDELDGTLYEFDEEPKGGCMADFDKECGCESTSSPLETKREKFIREWDEGIAKLDNEQLQKAMKQAHEMSGLHYEAIKDEAKKNKYKDYKSSNVDVKTEKNMWDKVAEVAKQKWVHGICNPPSPDWKATNK